MKLKSVLFILCSSFSSYLCLAQTDSADFTFSINFQPSFHNSSHLMLSRKHLDNYAELIVNDDDWVSNNIDARSVTELYNFLLAYNYQIKGSIDTVAVSKRFHNGDSTLVYTVSAGTDGITTKGLFVQGNKSHAFEFWSPKKGSEDLMLVNLVFKILEKSFTTEKATSYIAQVKTYYQ